MRAFRNWLQEHRRGAIAAGAGVVALGLVLVILLVLVIPSGPSKRQNNSSGCPPTSTSALPATLVPGCGVLWGFYSPANSVAATAAVETAVGRQFDIVKHYHDFSNTPNGMFPTAGEKAQSARGSILHETWDPVLFGRTGPGMPTPDGVTASGRRIYTWSSVADGQLDPYIDTVAAAVRSYGQPLFIDFSHENDIADPACGTRGLRRRRPAHCGPIPCARCGPMSSGSWVFVGMAAPATIQHPALPVALPG